jgi:hypothetical protein
MARLYWRNHTSLSGSAPSIDPGAVLDAKKPQGFSPSRICSKNGRDSGGARFMPALQPFLLDRFERNARRHRM